MFVAGEDPGRDHLVMVSDFNRNQHTLAGVHQATVNPLDSAHSCRAGIIDFFIFKGVVQR
jgi:hypothetical protein